MAKQVSLFKFIKDAKESPPVPPPPKRVKLNPDPEVVAQKKKDAAKAYDHKRSVEGRGNQNLVAQWCSDYGDWVIRDQEKLYCKPCREIYGPYGRDSRTKAGLLKEQNKYTKLAAGPFVSGYKITTGRRQALSEHEKSQGHKDAVMRVKAKNDQGTSEAAKMRVALNSSVYDRLEKLFRTSHAIAMHSRPFSDFTWQCELDKMKGLDIGNTYVSDKYCRRFVAAISEVERQKIRDLLKNSHFTTLLSDGSTDVAVMENEIVYIKFATKGKVHVFFVAMISVAKANADGIFSAIKDALNYYGNSEELLKKVVSYCCDGATVNTGVKNGVISKFRNQVYDAIVLIHCLVHRLELAYKDCIKDNKLYNRMGTLLNGVYSFYSTSPKQREELKDMFKALNLKVLLPLRTGGTRWLSHTLKALCNLWGGYRAIVRHLEQTVETDGKLKAKAVGLLKLLKCKNVILFAHFLHDILDTLQPMSLSMQATESTIYDCHQKLEVTVATLEKMKTRSGFHLRQVYEKSEFQEVTLTGTDASFNATRMKVLDNLLRALEERYKDVKYDLLKSTHIASLKCWPLHLEDDFGDEDVTVLASHFTQILEASGADVGAMDNEWTSLKILLYKSKCKPQSCSWAGINELYGAEHGNILRLIDLVLSLPASTAECERGFSRMKITKTDYRNKLKADTLTDLLTIQLSSEPVATFEPKPCIEYWLNKGKSCRRPNYMTQKVHVFEDKLAEAEAAETESTAECVVSTSTEAGDFSDSGAESDYSDFGFEDCSSDELEM